MLLSLATSNKKSGKKASPLVMLYFAFVSSSELLKKTATTLEIARGTFRSKKLSVIGCGFSPLLRATSMQQLVSVVNFSVESRIYSSNRFWISF